MSSSRLDRLMRLAQKTGDTLIIHDTEGRDMVLLDVDRYEMMIEENDGDCCGGWDDVGYHEMSEGQMLDKINRDIAIWRSHQEEDERGHRARVLEHDMVENPLPDPFEEDFSHSTDWHKAGSILEDRHGRFKDEINFGSEYEDDHMPNYRFGSSAEPDFSPLVKPYFGDEDDEMYDLEDDDEDFDPHFDPFGIDEEDQAGAGDKVVYDSLGEDSLYDTSEKQQIPFVDHGAVEMRKDDDDEPVFFEEPI